MSRFDSFAIGVVIGMLIVILTMNCTGASPEQVERHWQEEAVYQGAAEWVLTNEPGPDAQYEFRWLNDNVYSTE